MSPAARVQSVEAIGVFRASLWKFGEALAQAAGQAQGELQQLRRWLEDEAGPHWQRQVRVRHEQVRQATAELNHRRLYRSVDGSRQSSVEQQKQLAVAKRGLEEAERKLANVKRGLRELEVAMREFQPALGRMERAAEQIVPGAVGHLDRLVEALKQYLAIQPAVSRQGEAEKAEHTESIARLVEEGEECIGEKPDVGEGRPDLRSAAKREDGDIEESDHGHG